MNIVYRRKIKNRKKKKKKQFNFKIHDVIGLTANNYNTHSPISQKVKTIMQWIGIFFLKINAENEAGGLAPDLFFLFEKALYKIKRVVRSLVWICFGRPRLGHTIKTSHIRTEILISWRRKELLRWKKKCFSSFPKGFQLPKIVSDMKPRL